jgi:hypothetical protein
MEEEEAGGGDGKQMRTEADDAIGVSPDSLYRQYSSF